MHVPGIMAGSQFVLFLFSSFTHNTSFLEYGQSCQGRTAGMRSYCEADRSQSQRKRQLCH